MKASTRTQLLIAATALGVCGLIACGSMADAAFSDGVVGPTTNVDAGSGFGGGDGTGTGSAPNDTNDNSVNGIIAVHASRNLPAFRLCFPKKLTLLPLPDDKLMPNANVVGVDVGTAVHIGTFDDHANGSPVTPQFDGGSGSSFDAGIGEGGTDGGASDAGKATSADAGPAPSSPIYVIEEKLARQFYPVGADASTYPNCAGVVSVLQNNGYEGHGLYTIGPADGVPADVLSNGGVNLLVIEGCLPDSDPSVNTTSCGDNYTAALGNLRYRIISQLPTPPNQDAGTGVFSFQTMLLSPRISAALLAHQTATFTFGPIGAAGQSDDLGPGLSYGQLNPAMPDRVAFTATSDSDYDKYGFTLAYGADAGIAQSLATVQTESSPRDLPSSFYLLPSNFVVLIVGDPQVAATSAGPGASLHLLAVPVRDPDTLTGDGGADGGAQ